MTADSPSESGRRRSSVLDRSASRLLPEVYDELRRVARRYLAREWRGRTIQATELVHEAYLKLHKDGRQRWRNRTHFLAIAAIAMRRLLVERARARGAAKRGGDRVRITLAAPLAAAPAEADPLDPVALDRALARLAELDPQQARIVELRYFGGLTVEETAEALSVSPATVKREWTVARAWLRRELGRR